VKVHGVFFDYIKIVFEEIIKNIQQENAYNVFIDMVNG